MFSPQPRRRPVRLDKREAALTKSDAWVAVRRVVRNREGGKCRLCGKPGWDPHHIVFRSHGGKDVASNLVLLCRHCHEDAHGRVLKLAGDAQTKRGLRVARWNDEAHGWLWEAVT